MDVKNYIKAARLRTLPLSFSGIIVGSLLAKQKGLFDWQICVLAILTTIGFQVLSNFANDYGDGIKGADDHRVGEQRLVASGLISAGQMKRAIIYTTIITLVIALWLIYASFGRENFLYSILFFFLGIASIAAAIKYTVGKTAYGYSGFGDLFVFVFFGFVSVLGSHFLFTKQLDFFLFLPATAVGLLSVAVLNLNNMRDLKNDQRVHKNTLVVQIGAKISKYYHYFLLITSLVLTVLFVVIHYRKPIQFLFLIAYLPLVKHLFFVVQNKEEKLLDGELKKVALSTFLFSILFGLGQIL
jgi:1,4-dihydroxy-2-naphthoate octaprenyltransferase